MRPSTPADAGAIVELFAHAGMVPNTAAQALSWKYWQPDGVWSGSRSFLLCRGETLYAHCGVIPRWCSWDGNRISVIQPIDWVARAGAGGAGVTLIKSLRRTVQLLLSVGGSEDTLRIVPYMGFRPVGRVTSYARPLHPLRRGLVKSAGELLRLARAYAWKITAPAAHAPEWQVRPLEAHQAELLTPVLPLSTARLSVLERSPALFQYMLSCPIAPFSLYAVERAGQVKGYFLLASAPGQVRIADCWVTSEDPADWRSLLNCIIAEAYKDPQAAELVAWANDPLLAQAMLACGFQRRFEVDVQVLPAPQATLPAAPLRLQLLDNDTAYLHRGTREFWT